MTEICEGVLLPAPEDERTDGKKPLKIRFDLLFDGTLNNLINIKEREANSDIYQENRSKGPNSYDNGRTNIAVMDNYIGSTADGYDYFYKVYIEGQGTLNLEGDSIVGYSLGGGESGVAARAELGIVRAIEKIKKNDKIKKEKHYIQKLTFDLFGFSRGAATARYAIFLLLKHKDRICNRLQALGYDIEKSAVEVCFVGLFDTVLSYYGSQYFTFTNNVLEQQAVVLAKKVVQLAAAEEHRKDFPLHNIKSTKCKGGEEYFLPGVHSDIGGSYNLANEKLLEKETDESKKVYMLTSDEQMTINSGDPQRMEQDRDYLLKQGWYKENEIMLEVVENDEYEYLNHATLTVKRNAISSAYCNIPLKIMAEFARQPEINLKINEKLEDRANRILNTDIYGLLAPLEAKIRNYIASNKNSKPEDWLNDATLKEVRHKHLHFSAKTGIGYSPRFAWDNKAKQHRRTRYEYDA